MDKLSAKGAEKFYYRKRAQRIISICLAAALAVIFSIAFALDFEVQSALFKSGSIFGGVAFYSACISAAALYLITPILIPKEEKTESSFPKENEYLSYYTLDNDFVRIFRIATCFVLMVQSIVYAVVNTLSDKAVSLMTVLIAVTGIIFAFYFLPELAEKLASGGRLHIVCGMVGLLWLFLNIIDTYFDRSYPIASEYFTLSQIGFVLALLALVFEMRYRLDGTYVRARLASSASVFSFGFGFGVGRLVMLMAVGQISFADTASTFAMLFISLYFGVRIFFYDEA